MNTTSTTVPTITLNNGVAMPQLGFGVFQVSDEETTAAVTTALEDRIPQHRHGRDLRKRGGRRTRHRESGIARDELFITTKLWNSDQGAKDPRRLDRPASRSSASTTSTSTSFTGPAPSPTATSRRGPRSRSSSGG